MAKDLEQVGHLLDLDRPHAAWRLLRKIDTQYAELASAEILEMDRRIGSRR